MSGRNIHVVRIEGLQWVIEVRGGSDGRQFFPNRAEAIAAGTAKAQEEKVDLIIHTRDGRICRRMSFGSDPRDIKGKCRGQPATAGTEAGRALVHARYASAGYRPTSQE